MAKLGRPKTNPKLRKEVSGYRIYSWIIGYFKQRKDIQVCPVLEDLIIKEFGEDIAKWVRDEKWSKNTAVNEEILKVLEK